MKLQKLTQKGIAHYAIPLAVVLLIAAIGTAVLVKSHASPSNSVKSASSDSLSVVMVKDVDASDSDPSAGDTITFKLQTASTQPYVFLTCYQNGTLVYSTTAGFFSGYPYQWAQNMNLASGTWTSGAANCTAKLSYASGKKFITAATLDFNVTAN